MQSDAEQIQYLVGVLRVDKFIVYTCYTCLYNGEYGVG